MIGGLVSLVIMVVIFWAFWKFLLKEMVNDILASSRRQREVEVERERARVLREALESQESVPSVDPTCNQCNQVRIPMRGILVCFRCDLQGASELETKS
jgi:hypothetical protein